MPQQTAGIRLVAVDLDGTLLTSDLRVAPEGAEALREAAQRGVTVVVATARQIRSARPFCEELGIRDPVICVNGALTLGSYDGEILDRRLLPLDVARAVAARADAGRWALSVTIGDLSYRPDYGPRRADAHLRYVPTNLDTLVAEPARMVLIDPAGCAELRSFCETELAGRCRVEETYSPDRRSRWISILPTGACKGLALARLGRRLSVPSEHVLAIGDDLGDARMFEHAGIGVAMDNARDEVRERASVIAPGNDEEGVAWAIRRLVLS